MHRECQVWLDEMRASFPQHFREGMRVFEAGSRDINGSVRPWWPKPAEYVGIDWQAGPCVDVVGFAHRYDNGRAAPECEIPGEISRWRLNRFDVCVTTNAIEHDVHWRLTVRRMAQLVRDGGLVLIHCAGPLFPPHEPDCGVNRYYAGLRSPEILAVLSDTRTLGRIIITDNGSDMQLAAEVL